MRSLLVGMEEKWDHSVLAFNDIVMKLYVNKVIMENENDNVLGIRVTSVCNLDGISPKQSNVMVQGPIILGIHVKNSVSRIHVL